MVEKRAKARQRAPRKDQSQESILQMKDEINARTSRLIELLKKTKSGLNGGPAPDIGVEKYKLTDPMPSEVAQSGRVAIQELNSILEGIQRADQMQDDYAAERVQRLYERTQKMQEIQQDVEVKAALDLLIRKEASNKLTRLWANIVAPFGSEKGKAERLSLLNALGRVDNNLQEVEDKVLSNDPSILDAIHLSKNLYADAKATFFSPFRANLKEMLETSNSISSDLLKSVKEQERKLDEKKKNLEKEKTQKEREELKSRLTKSRPSQPLDEKINIDKKIENLDENIKEEPLPKAQRVEVPKPAKKPVEEPQKSKPSFINDDSFNTKNVVPVDVPKQKPTKDVVNVPSLKIDVPMVEEPSRVVEKENIVPEIQEIIEESVPESIPEVSPDERSIIYRRHLVENIQQLYREVFQSVSELGSIPDPWDDRIRNQWSALNAQADYATKLIISSIPDGFDIKKYIEKQHIQYLMFIKLVGDIKTSVNAYKTELNLSNGDDSFEFGTTIDEKSLQDQALNFTEAYRKELQTIAKISYGLVSLASNSFTRMLKRFRTQMSWGKIDRSLRLSVDRNLRTSRDNLQQMMDNLEKRNIDFRSLISSSIRFYDSLIDVYTGLASLGEMYNSRMFIEKSKRKSEKEHMPYDLIRETDIRSMKTIARELQKDKEDIKELYSLEESIPDLEAKLNRLQGEYAGLN